MNDHHEQDATAECAVPPHKRAAALKVLSETIEDANEAVEALDVLSGTVHWLRRHLEGAIDAARADKKQADLRIESLTALTARLALAIGHTRTSLNQIELHRPPCLSGRSMPLRPEGFLRMDLGKFVGDPAQPMAAEPEAEDVEPDDVVVRSQEQAD